MATVRELLTTWGFDIDTAALDQMDESINSLEQGALAVGQSIDRVGQGMKDFGLRMTTFVTLPLVGLAGALAKTASDAEETESKFATVFKSIETSANEASKNLRDNFGLDSLEAKKLLGDTGDLLTGFGFAQGSALDLSVQVQELAVDLASFTNIEGGAKRASDALTKALLGERESVKSLGISILEEDVKKQVAVNSTKGLTFESNRQAKAFATLQIAQRQSQNAIGDFARTQGSTANQMKLLTRDIREEALVLGKILLPALKSLVQTARDAVLWFSQLEAGTKENIILFLGFVAAIGPVIFLLGILLVSIATVIRTYALLKIAIIAARTAMIGFTLASLIIPAILLGIGLALGVVIDDFRNFFAGNKSALGVWLGDWKDVKDDILEVFDDIVEGVSLAIEEIANILSSTTPAEGFKKLKDSLSGLKFLPGFVGETLGVTQEGLSNITDPTRLGPAASGSISRSSTVNVNASIAMTVPEGTPAQQVSVVQEAGRKVVQEEISIILRRLNNEFPEVE